MMERRAREAELIATKLVEDYDYRYCIFHSPFTFIGHFCYLELQIFIPIFILWHRFFLQIV